MKKRYALFTLIVLTCAYVLLVIWSNYCSQKKESRIESVAAPSGFKREMKSSFEKTDTNQYGENELSVQTRMADASDRSVHWSGFGTIIAALIGGFSIYLTVKQSYVTRKWDDGSIDIDFENLPIDLITVGIEKYKFKSNFKVLYFGKSMYRMISSRFELSKKDFMHLDGGWWKRIQSEEIEQHKILVDRDSIPMEIVSLKDYTLDEMLDLIEPIIRPRVKVEPMCLFGYLKYHNGLGETWIKQFIFRFEWETGGGVKVLPWGRHCTPVKRYPTLSTRIYEFGERHPKLFPITLRISDFLRE